MQGGGAQVTQGCRVRCDTDTIFHKMYSKCKGFFQRRRGLQDYITERSHNRLRFTKESLYEFSLKFEDNSEIRREK